MDNREGIINELMTKLKTITMANGFETDAGNFVEHWNTDLVPEGQKYLISVEDRSVELIDEFSHRAGFMDNLIIDINLGVQDGINTYASLMKGSRDIYKAVGTNEDVFIQNHKCDLVRPIRSELEIQEGEKIRGAIKITILFRNYSKRWYLT